MERSPCCPQCLMRFPDIHGVIYVDGHYQGQCENAWHYSDRNYDSLVLTTEDQEFLAAQNIGF